MIHAIDSLNTPELEPYRTLRRPLEHARQGIFVAEGARVVLRLLESRLEIISILLTEEWLTFLQTSTNLNDRDDVRIFVGTKGLVESIVGYNLHQGIMAVARVPQEQSLEATMSEAQHPRLLVALDGLVNSENVGIVVRNCAGFGVHAILVGETSSSPYLRRAVRNSMGTVFKVPIVHVKNLVSSLTTLHERFTTTIIGTDPHAALPISETNLRDDVCIVFGNEGDGISASVLDVCSARAAVPMMGGTDSLNVASASAVFLYEARKQRAGAH
jgi:tRNA G18 (ribose-2'-O)-methylase SpoU